MTAKAITLSGSADQVAATGLGKAFPALVACRQLAY
jgi:hypothetical protein